MWEPPPELGTYTFSFYLSELKRLKQLSQHTLEGCDTICRMVCDPIYQETIKHAASNTPVGVEGWRPGSES